MLAALLPAGVAVMRGDKVLGGRWEGSHLKEVFTANGITLQAEEFILATGRFFSGGLAASMDRIYEPVFGADVAAPKDRSLWYDPDIRKPQPFESFGVKTTADGHILIDGRAADNVKAVGKILAKDYAGQ
ncbi:MAG: FAD-binding protein [Bacteroidales bacterium]|nr:FAD-binding protein [Bacteroidales bacterium]